MYEKAAAGIARVYAKGALEFATTGTDARALWADFLGVFGQWVKSHPSECRELRLLRQSPSRLDTCIKTTCVMVGDNRHFCNFIKLLVRNNRIGLAPLIAQAYWSAWDAQLQRLNVRCVHAKSLDAQAQDRLVDQLQTLLSAPFRMTWQQDSKLINGFKLIIDDKTLDLSGRAFLLQFKESLMPGSGSTFKLLKS